MATQILKSKNKGTRYKPLVMGPEGKWMCSHTWDRKVDAEREERELLSLRDKGANSNIFAPLPFSEAADIWLRDCEKRVGLSQRKRIKMYINNYFLPYFGNRDIKRIKPSDIASFVHEVSKNDIASATINSVVTSLKAMFNFHIEEDNIGSNPVKKKHRVGTGIQKDIIVWTPDEAVRFLEYANKKYSGARRWMYLVYKIGLNTGMRYGEIIALEKGDFDFDKSTIRISKSHCSISGEVKTPKNGKARTAPLSPSLAEEIKKYLIDNQIFGPLFLKKNEEYYSYFAFHKAYKKDVKSAGVRTTKFHNVRRFYITQYVQRGGSEPQLRKIVGHGSVGMTDLYTAQLEDMKNLGSIINL